MPSSSRPRTGALLVCAAIALAPPAARPATEEVPESPRLPARLGLEEALRIFRERGLDLLIAEAAVQGAEGDVRAAGAVANPAVSFGVGKSYRCAPGACQDLAYSAGLSDQAALEATLSGKRGLRVDVARAALEAARASRTDAERTLGFQVKQQFLASLIGQRALDYAREAQAATREMFNLSQVRFKAGAISEADVARVEVLKLEAEQGVEAAAQAATQAKLGLAFLLGVRAPLPEFEAEGPELLKAAVPSRLQEATPESLLALARKSRPDLRAAEYQKERAAASLALARRLRFPDIALSLQYVQEGTGATAVTPPTYTLGLSLPLPLFYQQQGEVARAEADRRAQHLQEARLEAQVAADVGNAHAAFTASQRMVDRMETRLLDRARLARDLVQLQYRKGAASLLDYLDAERTYIAVQVEYLTDLTAYWTALFQLEQAVGTSLR